MKKVGDKENKETIKNENIVTKETTNLVRYALESVVANGSGRNAYIEGYRVGGKTGTAQKVGTNGAYMDGNYILSFMGFMPANDPKYVTYIALDHPQGVTQYGGVVAAPIAKNVFKQIISIYDLKEDYEGLPMSYRWDDIKYITIPDITGKELKEASRTLKALGLNVEYTGNGKVIDTSPKINSRVKEGSIVKLLLNE